jgi:WD40 repeat protein
MTRVFISYSSKNRKQAKAVQKSLEAAGLEVWRDQRKIENDWSAEIAQGLTQADLVCLLWSREAAESRWVKNEWLTARALEKLIVPCLFPDAPHLPAQIENMQGVQFLDTPSGLRDLLQHFKRRTAFHWKYDFRAPPLRGYVPFAPDDEFTGRKQDLVEIYLKLIGQLNKIGINHVGIAGMGGVGKTELAIEFAHRFGFVFDGVYWLEANDTGQIAAALVRLARDRLSLEIDDPGKSGAATRYARALYSYAKKHPQMLLILDNVAEPISLTKPSLANGHFGPLDLGCNLLFTTRIEVEIKSVIPHSLEVIAPEFAFDLLTRGRRPEDSQETRAAREITNAVGYLPLALALIGSHLRKFPHISYVRYLATLRQQKLGAIDATKIDRSELATRHQAAVGATLDSQWKALRGPAAKLALKVAAHFPEGAVIPVRRLGLLIGLSDEESATDLPLSRALNRLQQLSLLGKGGNSFAVRVHPLVAALVRNLVPERQRADFLLAAATKLEAAYDDPFRLKSEYSFRGIDQVIEDLNVAIAWANRNRAVDIKLRQLEHLLDRERHVLRPSSGKKPAQTNPALQASLFQQLHQRAAILRLAEPAAKFLQAGLREGQPMLKVRASNTAEDFARRRTFQGHERAVKSVALSADDGYLLTGSMDGTIILWDVPTGQILRRLPAEKTIVEAAAISPDGRRAISGGWGKKLVCWDLETREKLWQRSDHCEAITFIQIASDGLQALAGSLDRNVLLLDVSTGRKIERLKCHKRAITAGALSIDGRHAVTGDTDGTVAIWDLENRSCLYSFQIDRSTDNIQRGITALSFTPDAKFAAIACGYSGRDIDEYLGRDREGRLFLWDIESRRVICDFKGHAGSVKSAAFTRDGKRLVSGSSDKTLKLWDVSAGRCLRTFRGHTAGVTSVVLTGDGRSAVSGGLDMNAILWDLDAPDQGALASGHSLAVRSASLSCDASLAITGSDDNSIIVWNARSGNPLRIWEAHQGIVNSVRLSADGSRAVSGDERGTLILWDPGKDEPVRIIETGKGSIHAVNLSPDGRMLLSGSFYTWLIVWDATTGELLQGFRHPKASRDDDSDGVRAILVDKNNDTAITAGEDSKKLFRWDLKSFPKAPDESLAEFKGHSAGVLALDQDADNTRILSGSEDRTAILWSARDQRPLLRLEGHSQAVYGVALASAERAITISWDKTLILWNLTSGQPMLRLFFESPLWTIAARGSRVIAGDTGGAVYFFDI